MIHYDKDGDIVLITLDRPEVLNAFDADTKKEFELAFEKFELDSSLRVAIITGSGNRAFCTGADLKNYIPDVINSGITVNSNRFLSSITKPVIAAVNGYCLAGGLEILLGTDIRYACPEARFGLPESRWGIVPAGGGQVRLPRQLPWVYAMEILMTGRHFSAEEALRMGLINKIIPANDLLDEAFNTARLIASNSPLALRTIKRIARNSYGLSESEAFMLESNYSQPVFQRSDAKEGSKAFLERRTPKFQDD